MMILNSTLSDEERWVDNLLMHGAPWPQPWLGSGGKESPEDWPPIYAHRNKELAKFEAYLNKEDCQNINALVRGRTRMSYPIRR